MAINEEQMRALMRRSWTDAATESEERRPSMQVVDGRFVLTNTNRATWYKIAQGASVPAHAEQSITGDTLVCSWESHADTIFGRDGAIAQRMTDYEQRIQQTHMARLVQRAAEMRECAVIEAPTGTGKSLAYLAPLMAMGKKVIVSTSNKALQAQLHDKDVPFLQQLFPHYTVALAVGKSNYACRAKVEDPAAGRVRIDDPRLRDWYLSTATGNTEEIPFAADTSAIRLGEDCTGKHCPYFADCFYYLAKNRRAKADIIICNHALLCQHALFPFAKLLPEADVIVIDEAHALAGYARAALGESISMRQIERTIKLAQDNAAALGAADALAAQVRRLASDDPQTAIPPDAELGGALIGELERLADAMWVDGLEPEDNAQARLARRAKRIRNLADALAGFAKPALTGAHVRWIERSDGGLTLVSQPVAVDGIIASLRTGADGNVPLILTSATLAAPDLDMFMDSVGLDCAMTMQAASPFDYANNALLYIPRAMTDIAQELQQLVEASRGGAFLLFTSIAQLNTMHTALARIFQRQGLRVWRQGDMSRQEIARQFRADGNGVLFATRTFFEGVSIDGNALRLVVLDKLPFEPPSPLGSAMETAFGGWHRAALPQMLIDIKQATGRLIRTRTDRGVIAILDSRVRTKSYGRAVMSVLPPAPATTSIEVVREFYERMRPTREDAGGESLQPRTPFKRAALVSPAHTEGRH